jgi:uncharacterized protein YabN with tetrapyrrole methylase and pyrophosphatase domain
LEGKKQGGSGALSGVPAALPALVRAHRMQEKAARQGVDWPDGASARAEVRRNLEEFLSALEERDNAGNGTKNGNGSPLDQALANLLWSVVGAARLAGLHSEEALRFACDQFRSRFEATEALASEAGTSLADLTADQRANFWEAAQNFKK